LDQWNGSSKLEDLNTISILIMLDSHNRKYGMIRFIRFPLEYLIELSVTAYYYFHIIFMISYHHNARTVTISKRSICFEDIFHLTHKIEIPGKERIIIKSLKD